MCLRHNTPTKKQKNSPRLLTGLQHNETILLSEEGLSWHLNIESGRTHNFETYKWTSVKKQQKNSLLKTGAKNVEGLNMFVRLQPYLIPL